MDSKTKLAGGGVAILLAVLVAVFGFNGDSDTQQPPRQTPPKTFSGDVSNKLQAFTEGIQEDQIVRKVIHGKLVAGENQDVFTCPDGRAWRVSLRSFSLASPVTSVRWHRQHGLFALSRVRCGRRKPH